MRLENDEILSEIGGDEMGAAQLPTGLSRAAQIKVLDEPVGAAGVAESGDDSVTCRILFGEGNQPSQGFDGGERIQFGRTLAQQTVDRLHRLQDEGTVSSPMGCEHDQGLEAYHNMCSQQDGQLRARAIGQQAGELDVVGQSGRSHILQQGHEQGESWLDTLRHEHECVLDRGLGRDELLQKGWQ